MEKTKNSSESRPFVMAILLCSVATLLLVFIVSFFVNG